MRKYLLEHINRLKQTFSGESFNAKKAQIIAQVAKVRKRKEYWQELNKKADKLCKEFKKDWLDKIELAAKNGKTGVTLKKPYTTLLNSEPVYAKLERKFKKLGYNVERDGDEFTISWGD